MPATSYKDRIAETSTFTGGGTVALLGAINGFASFTRYNASQSGIPVLFEAIDASNQPTGDWEVSLCTLSADKRTLTRNTVRDSSNAGALVSFAAGTKRVTVVNDGMSVEAKASLAGGNALTGDQNVAGNVSTTGTVNALGGVDQDKWLSEKYFTVNFVPLNASINQKVKFFWPNPTRLQGRVEITAASGFDYVWASGYVKKIFGMHLTETGGVSIMHVSSEGAGACPGALSISDIQWDAGSSRWFVIVGGLPGQNMANIVGVTIKTYATADDANLWWNMAASKVVMGAPYVDAAVSLTAIPTGISVGGNITASGTITSTGTPLATVGQLANYLPLTGGNIRPAGNANAYLTISPGGSGIYSILEWWGDQTSAASGLTIMAGQNQTWLNADTYTFRKANGTTNLLTLATDTFNFATNNNYVGRASGPAQDNYITMRNTNYYNIIDMWSYDTAGSNWINDAQFKSYRGSGADVVGTPSVRFVTNPGGVMGYFNSNGLTVNTKLSVRENPSSNLGVVQIFSDADPGTLPAALNVRTAGIGGGAAVPQYGIRVDAQYSYNGASAMYGVWSKAGQNVGGPCYGVWGETPSTNSTTEGHGVHGKATYNTGAVNGGNVGVYGEAVASGTSMVQTSHAARFEHKGAYGALNIGVQINTITGGTTVKSLVCQHDGVAVFEVMPTGPVVPAGKVIVSPRFKLGTGAYDTCFLGPGGPATGNIAIGNDGYVLAYTTSATGNVGIGSNAGYQVSTSPNNILIGGGCGQGLTTGAGANTAVGTSAMYGGTGAITGDSNVAIGNAALYYLTTGGSNVSLGVWSGGSLTTGIGNVFVGTSAGGGITTGSGNTIIGHNTSGNGAGLVNNLRIATGAGDVMTDNGTTTNFLHSVTSGGTALATVSQLANYLPLSGGVVLGLLGVGTATDQFRIFASGGGGTGYIQFGTTGSVGLPLVIGGYGGVDLTSLNLTATTTYISVGGTAIATINSAGMSLPAGKTITIGGVDVTTTPNDSVTNLILANMPAYSVKANTGTVTGDPSDLTLASSQLVGRGATGGVSACTLGATLTFTGLALGVASVPTSLTFAASGGAAAGTTFNGATARTVDYSTVGAAPAGVAVQSAASDTVTPTFSDDIVQRLAVGGTCTMNTPTGTAVNGWGIVVRLRSAAANAISWVAAYRSVCGVALPTVFVANKLLYIGMIYNSTDAKWDVTSIVQEA